MKRIAIESFVKVGSDFLPVADVPGYDGDAWYVEGAISLVVDGVEILGIELWDDVNWLWPFIILALEECRQGGSGRRNFPDQPIGFRAEKMQWAGHVLLTVTDGGALHRSAVAPEAELYTEVARAASVFFRELGRICPEAVDASGRIEPRQEAMLDEWLAIYA